MSTIIALFKNEAPDDTSNRKRLVRDTLVEFLATTVFVYFGTFAAVSTGKKLVGSGEEEDVARILPIAIAFGVSILALVYAIGHITGKIPFEERPARGLNRILSTAPPSQRDWIEYYNSPDPPSPSLHVQVAT